MGSRLRVAHLLSGCRMLGPGRRFIIWVAGCARRCPGCVAGPILERRAGRWMNVPKLARHVLAEPGIDGVTFSGGEPFEQAGALAELCVILREHRDLSLMSYSGFTLEELQSRADAAELLTRLDLLVDGPFLQAQAVDRRWRGSENQRIHVLTRRHADDPSLCGPDESAGVEFRVRPGGRLFWAGVPGIGFPGAFAAALRAEGIRLSPTRGGWA